MSRWKGPDSRAFSFSANYTEELDMTVHIHFHSGLIPYFVYCYLFSEVLIELFMDNYEEKQHCRDKIKYTLHNECVLLFCYRSCVMVPNIGSNLCTGGLAWRD